MILSGVIGRAQRSHELPSSLIMRNSVLISAWLLIVAVSASAQPSVLSDPASPPLSTVLKEIAPASLATASAELRARADRALLIAQEIEARQDTSSLSRADRSALSALTSVPADTLAAGAATIALRSIASTLSSSAQLVDAERQRLGVTPSSQILPRLNQLASKVPGVSVFGPRAGDSIDAGVRMPVPLIGGDDTRFGTTTEYPEVALLLFRKSSSAPFNPTCSGTLINSDVIATAAHCLCRDRLDNIVAGASCPETLASRNPENWLVFFQHAGFKRVRRTIPSSKFQLSPKVQSDAGVLLLSSAVTSFPPAPLPIGLHSKAGDEAVLVGYGQSFVSGGPGMIDAGLKRAGFAVLGACNTAMGAGSFLCWSGKDSHGFLATCKGDSGGPMEQRMPVVTLVGITSFSDSDCPHRGIYENTSIEDSPIQNFLMSPDGSPRLTSQNPNHAVSYPTNLLPRNTVYDLGVSGATSTSLIIDDPWQTLTISANSSMPPGGPAQPLRLVVLDSAGKPACSVEGGGAAIPSAASCTIALPKPGTIRIQVTGLRKSVVQLVAAAYY